MIFIHCQLIQEKDADRGETQSNCIFHAVMGMMTAVGEHGQKWVMLSS
jgi:hypothetical protein